MRVAIVGSGIAGLGSAWLLAKAGHAVTVFEANDYLGGHTHTVDVTLDGVTAPVDTGFLVFNDRTYPHLLALFGELGVASVPSQMSFAVTRRGRRRRVGGNRPRRAVRAAAQRAASRFLADARRHPALQPRDDRDAARGPDLVGDARRVHRQRALFGTVPRLVPAADGGGDLVGADAATSSTSRWRRSCASATTTGCSQVSDRPQWRTVSGGAREYVARIAARLPDVRLGDAGAARPAPPGRGVEIEAGGRAERISTRSCSPATATRRSRCSPTRRRAEIATAVLDPLPAQPRRAAHRRRAAAEVPPRLVGLELPDAARTPTATLPPAVSYLINKLQPLPFRTPVIVTLNPPFEPDPAKLLQEFEYWHPLLDGGAIARSRRVRAHAGRAPHLVRRRVAGLRLPRGRPASRRTRSPPASLRRARRRRPTPANRCRSWRRPDRPANPAATTMTTPSVHAPDAPRPASPVASAVPRARRRSASR